MSANRVCAGDSPRARGSVVGVSTDEGTDSAAESTRASVERDSDPAHDNVGAASDTAAQAILDIEQQPLEARAPGYQALADRLRVELEQSDPHAAR